MAGHGAGAAPRGHIHPVEDGSAVLGVVEVPAVERDAGCDVPRVRLGHHHIRDQITWRGRGLSSERELHDEERDVE